MVVDDRTPVAMPLGPVLKIIYERLSLGEVKGRVKYGPDFVGDPLVHAFEETCDSLRYLVTERVAVRRGGGNNWRQGYNLEPSPSLFREEVELEIMAHLVTAIKSGSPDDFKITPDERDNQLLYGPIERAVISVINLAGLISMKQLNIGRFSKA